jgi:dihydrofolate synthase/folylpolyglutamate synthase
MKKYSNSYKDAVQYLYSLQKYGIKFGLSKTSDILKKFGNPHVGRRFIHIAGTNGKGSVAAMMESVLIKAGYKVGFYSSPHLVRFTERFRINRQEIPFEKASKIIAELRRKIDKDNPPTFFEAATALALIYFAREKTDIDIMEVGMGGRLDATNIIVPDVSVITNISLEHQFFLGSTLTAIAGEKAGIIKKGIDVITAATQKKVVDLFQEICKQRKARLWILGKDIRYRSMGSRLNYYGFNRRLKDLEPCLKGKFQRRNASLALAALEILEKKGISISSEDIREGLKDAYWPGRMHTVSRDPLIILDGAHNPDAIRILSESIEKGINYKRLILVLGIMADKDTGRIIKKITPLADYTIFSRPEYYRSAEPEDLMKKASGFMKNGEAIHSLRKAIDKARSMAGPDDLVLITGSLFTVGEALSYLDPANYTPDGF